MTSSGELAMKFAAMHLPAPRSRRSSNVSVTSAMVLQGWQVAWRVTVVGEAERRKVSIVREQSGHGSVMIGFIDGSFLLLKLLSLGCGLGSCRLYPTAPKRSARGGACPARRYLHPAHAASESLATVPKAWRTSEAAAKTCTRASSSM